MSGRFGRRASAGGGTGHLEISEAHGIHLVHTAGRPPEALTETAARLRASAGEITVLVSAGFGDPEALCARLRPVLARTSPVEGRLVRLVMSGAAAETADRPAPGRMLSDALETDVLAPLGAALVTPAGTLFAPRLPGRPGGWRRFSPGREPVSVGARHPAPRWQQAVERVVPTVAGGCAVEQVPAGLLILPSGTPPEGVGALRYAVPPQAERPLLLVGAAHTRAVPPQAVADVLAALPATVREAVRLVSADGSDPLPVGRQVAALLGVPVEVGSGLPLLVSDPARPVPTGPLTPRTVLTDAAGEPTWRPYVEEVVCEPEGDAGATVRLGTWRPPVSGLRPALEPGAMILDRRWQVVVTRSGLWVGPNGGAPPAETVLRPVAPDVMAVEIGLPDQALPDTVWEPLERLFSALQDDVRDRTQIRLHGDPGDEVLNGMRRLAVRHGLALAPRGWQDTEGQRLSGTGGAGAASEQPAPARFAFPRPASVPPGTESLPSVPPSAEPLRSLAAPAVPPDPDSPDAEPAEHHSADTVTSCEAPAGAAAGTETPAAVEQPAGTTLPETAGERAERSPQAVPGPPGRPAAEEATVVRHLATPPPRATEAIAITFTPPATVPGAPAVPETSTRGPVS
ncbi:hypothetical protein SHL15_8383 [Streptomyces hygroscopicus subsp. limoneus]|nr:hypothetical protein SHL15_8383 [Streptomyces hygroscopicus subsp. limoneus]